VATAPATRPAGDSAEAWLDRIHAHAAEVKSLVAEVRYDRIQSLQGERQRRTGTLSYLAGPPAKFALHVTQLAADGRLEPQDVWYVFDGQWLVERDNLEKQFSKRQIVAPGTPPEQADPLASGEGPFLLPINASKERVLRRYDVSLVAPAEKDPANSVHLALVPKPGRHTDVTRIDIWYSRESLLPVRVQTTEQSEDQGLIELVKVGVNAEVDPKLFDVNEPRERGWHVDVKPWEGEE
jgi:hypothetical protein